MTMLESAVQRFAELTQSVSDIDLERAWVWGDYDEGLRFAFFRMYEDLRDLAARIAAWRTRQARPVTEVEHILGQYNFAYQDLKAVLLGMDDRLALQAPAEGEWPLRTILLHILEAQRSFFAVCSYGLDRARLRDDKPLRMSVEEWDIFWSGDSFENLKAGASITKLMDYFASLHERFLDRFTGMGDDELSASSTYWESVPMELRFRLHRFDSHLRQHTIQMEKTRHQIEQTPPEAQRLLRLIFNGLAEVQAISLGSGGIGQAECDALAGQFDARRFEIEATLKGEFRARPPD